MVKISLIEKARVVGKHHRYHTEFLDADIFLLVYSRGINILKLKAGALI